MPTIPLNLKLLWPGSNASIPAGWKRSTAFDGRFPKATDNLVNPNATGGADTHTHTSPNHTHTMINHTHSGNLGRSSGDFETHGGDNQHGASRDAHVHSYTTDSIQGGDLVGAVTYAAASSLPPYHELIFIEPDTNPGQLVDGIVALFGEGSIPTNWDVCDGDNGTPDLDGKYIRGAATGQDAGSTGGDIHHAHNVDHNHGAVGHAHQASPGNVGQSSDGDRERGNSVGGGGQVYDRNHRHVAFLNTLSETPSTYTADTAGSAETVEPLYKKLRAIMNNSGGPSKPRNIIGIWTGSLDAIPQGWFLCNGQLGTPDMRGYHLKCTVTEGEVGDTGGSNTHSHALSNSHTHTAPGSHTHSGSSSGGVPDTAYGTTANPDGASKPHAHSFLESCSSATSSWNATEIQADESNNEPAYRTVAFIMFKYETYGGAAVLAGVLNS